MDDPTSAQPAAGPTGDRLAAQLRGFGPLGIVSMLAILLSGTVVVGPMIALPVGSVLTLLWAKRSHTPWHEIGYVRPRSWLVTAAIGVCLGVALKFLMKAIVLPLLGADPINHAYHFLAGNRAMIPAALWAMVNAGFSEETVVRGFLFERLGKLLGSSPVAKTGIVLLTSALFGLAHYRDQGLAGAEQGAITGLVFGTIFACTGSIWVPMIAHAVFDLAAYAIIYQDLETAVAHLVFK